MSIAKFCCFSWEDERHGLVCGGCADIFSGRASAVLVRCGEEASRLIFSFEFDLLIHSCCDSVPCTNEQKQEIYNKNIYIGLKSLEYKTRFLL